MTDDRNEQYGAEQLDRGPLGEDAVTSDDAPWAEYPPERPLGAEEDEVTPVGEDRRESLAERVAREEPDRPARGGGEVPAPSSEPYDAEPVSDPADLSAEEAALHIEEGGPA